MQWGNKTEIAARQKINCNPPPFSNQEVRGECDIGFLVDSAFGLVCRETECL